MWPEGRARPVMRRPADHAGAGLERDQARGSGEALARGTLRPNRVPALPNWGSPGRCTSRPRSGTAGQVRALVERDGLRRVVGSGVRVSVRLC